MKFPTTDEFNKQIENQINNQNNNTKRILKWKELLTGVIYKIEESEKFRTGYELSTIVTLKSEDDKKLSRVLQAVQEETYKTLVQIKNGILDPLG